MTAQLTAESGSLTLAEIEAFAGDWYRALDQHLPAEQVAVLVVGEGTQYSEHSSHGDSGVALDGPRSVPMLEFVLPEGVLTGVKAFREWYEGVIRLFFDEVHTLTEVRPISIGDNVATVKVLVNWQARRWRPPDPRSEWIGFDADQDWSLVRSAGTGRPVIIRYVVNELRPMPGSPAL